MLKIEMLDDLGNVTELVGKVHACDGDKNVCESPALCEDCAREAGNGLIVYVWTTPSTGISYFACGDCLGRDEFANLVTS